MSIMIFPAALMAVGALAAFLLRRKVLAATAVGAGTLCGSALAGLILLVRLYLLGSTVEMGDIFLLPVLILSLAAGVHSLGYLAGHGSERSGTYWFFFNLTAAAMIMVTQAFTALEFLLAWEVMGVASFALVIFDRENVKAWSAGWIYLLACHAGAAFLILLFCFPGTPVVIFTLALIGFGLKIGFPLLHVWLPEAHPAAPAPVSALMSGAMIELGFYGLLIFGILPGGSWEMCGWVLTVLGAVTAPLGIIFALAQSNLKKLLAYSSIENMGILSIALGLGCLGIARDIPLMAVCGFGGAGAHLLNHALLKGGLFLASGSVYKATGTLDMDLTGGLLKRMPRTGTTFILHGLSLCGLPPSSGFAAEFFIYSAAFAGVGCKMTPVVVISAVILVILALTGGFAAAAFAKAIGAVFCGEPRSQAAQDAREVSWGMCIPVMVLFLLSIVFMFAMPLAVEYFGCGLFPSAANEITAFAGVAVQVSVFSGIALVLMTIFLILRGILTAAGRERISPTWDCGYAVPSAKMEYTAASFGRSMVEFFGFWLRPERKIRRPEGAFLQKASFEEEIEDGGIARFWKPVFLFVGKLSEKIHSLQSGSLHFYLLVLVLTLIAMLGFAVMRGN